MAGHKLFSPTIREPSHLPADSESTETCAGKYGMSGLWSMYGAARLAIGASEVMTPVRYYGGFNAAMSHGKRRFKRHGENQGDSPLVRVARHDHRDTKIGQHHDPCFPFESDLLPFA